MDHIKITMGIIGGISVLFTQMAFAVTESGNVSTVAAEPSLYDKLSERAALSYFGVYRGGALSDLGSAVNPTATGSPDLTSPQGVESLITTGYKINKNLMLGAITHFTYYPFLNPIGSDTRFQMLDPILMLSQSDIINRNGFKLSARLHVFLPLSKDDILLQQHLATAISPTLIINYDVPHSSLSLGIYGYVRGYIPNGDANADANSYKLYAAPNASYQISRTLAATLWVDLVQAVRTQNTGFISGMQNGPVDIEPGINWDITKNISINPVINIYPGNPTLAATSLQAFIVAKAF